MGVIFSLFARSSEQLVGIDGGDILQYSLESIEEEEESGPLVVGARARAPACFRARLNDP